jgi:hypothetical protein
MCSFGQQQQPLEAVVADEGVYSFPLAHRIHRTRLEWFDLQLGRADPLRFFHRGEV